MNFFSPDSGFSQALDRLGTLLILNFLTMICCVPVFTIGAALTALYSCTMRMARDEEGKIFVGYFRAFKENFKNSTLIWLPTLAILAFLVADIYILGILGASNVYFIYRLVMCLILFIVLVLLQHALMLTARFDNTIRKTLHNAVIFSVVKWYSAIAMMIVTLAPVIACMISLRVFWLVFLYGFSFPAYVISFYFRWLFRPYDGTAEEEEAEEDGKKKWGIFRKRG